MTGIQHREAANGGWQALSLAAQLGHVGSEVSRALKWRTRNVEIARNAFYRALELLDLTLDDPRHRTSTARLREIARAREVLVDFLDGRNDYHSTPETLQRYFDAFAVAASLERERSNPSAR